MFTMTDTLIEGTPPESLKPITTRWYRNHTAIAEWHYYWTVTEWETKDPYLQELLKEGILEDSGKTYTLLKPLILDQQSLCLDKSIVFDEKIDTTINECNIIKKNMEDGVITINMEKSSSNTLKQESAK